jgi:hypothetical protein
MITPRSANQRLARWSTRWRCRRLLGGASCCPDILGCLGEGAYRSYAIKERAVTSDATIFVLRDRVPSYSRL